MAKKWSQKWYERKLKKIARNKSLTAAQKTDRATDIAAKFNKKSGMTAYADAMVNGATSAEANQAARKSRKKRKKRLRQNRGRHSRGKRGRTSKPRDSDLFAAGEKSGRKRAKAKADAKATEYVADFLEEGGSGFSLPPWALPVLGGLGIVFFIFRRR